MALFWCISLIVILLTLGFNCERKPNMKVYFRASNSTEIPYLQMQSTLPELKEFTFCSWVRSEYIKLQSTILSYGTSHSSMELEISLRKRPVFAGKYLRLQLDKSFAVFDCSNTSFEFGIWYHLCLNLFSSYPYSHLMVNGKRCVLRSNELHRDINRNVPSGGVLMIGRKQISVTSSSSEHYGWIGDIADFNLWDEVLNENQMIAAGKCGGKRKKGNLISFPETPFALYGGAVISSTNLCEP